MRLGVWVWYYGVYLSGLGYGFGWMMNRRVGIKNVLWKVSISSKTIVWLIKMVDGFCLNWKWHHEVKVLNCTYPCLIEFWKYLENPCKNWIELLVGWRNYPMTFERKFIGSRGSEWPTLIHNQWLHNIWLANPFPKLYQNDPFLKVVN